MATYEVKSQGKQYTVTVVDKANGGSTVTIDGRDFEVELIGRDADPDSPTLRRAVPIATRVADPVNDGSILSPMPGKVVSVPVKVGDSIRADQVVLKLETMKMENDISSPIAGVVKELHVREGSEPSAGQLLMLIA